MRLGIMARSTAAKPISTGLYNGASCPAGQVKIRAYHNNIVNGKIVPLQTECGIMPAAPPPPPPPAPNINVNVPTNISPNFQQSFTPQVSPVMQMSSGSGSQGAGTSQKADGGQNAASVALENERRRAAEEAEHKRRLEDEARRAQEKIQQEKRDAEREAEQMRYAQLQYQLSAQKEAMAQQMAREQATADETTANAAAPPQMTGGGGGYSTPSQPIYMGDDSTATEATETVAPAAPDKGLLFAALALAGVGAVMVINKKGKKR